MKILISLSFILLFITSCGSSNKTTYTVTDDHNGTKSPRLKKIVTKTTDNNKSEEVTTQYTYNTQNLLISEETIYQNYSSIVSYFYNKDKQLKTIAYNNGSIVTSSSVEYIYGDILYEKTKLPVVDTVTMKSYLTHCTYKHTYILNSSNFATSIDKIHETCESSSFGHSENPNFHSNFSADESKIYSTDLTKHTENYNYYSQSATATYNKGLREKVEYYSPDETNATKAHVLERTSTYTYEKKPYFYKESSSPMVNLPH